MSWYSAHPKGSGDPFRAVLVIAVESLLALLCDWGSVRTVGPHADADAPPVVAAFLLNTGLSDSSKLDLSLPVDRRRLTRTIKSAPTRRTPTIPPTTAPIKAVPTDLLVPVDGLALQLPTAVQTPREHEAVGLDPPVHPVAHTYSAQLLPDAVSAHLFEVWVIAGAVAPVHELGLHCPEEAHLHVMTNA